MGITLPEGTPLTLTQSLGGSFTVVTPYGYMARVEGKDADAIGEEPVAAEAEAAAAAGKSVQDLCWDQLKTCFDPEIPVNIVDLGLVYSCELAPLPEGGQRVSVRFTLTAPGCGMGDYLKGDIETKLQQVPGIKEVDAQIAFDPPWDQTRMSEAAKLQLGLM
jgi:probable FeS assembly SUF system protein SufT